MLSRNRKITHWIVSLAGMAFFVGAAYWFGPRDDANLAPDEDALLERIRPVGVVMYPEDPRHIEALAKKPPRRESVSPPPSNPAALPVTSSEETLPATPIAGIPEPVAPHPGESTFNSACAACHLSGLAGAPKPGDPEAWASRRAQGTETLIRHALEGFQGSTGLMPAKGGRTDLGDSQVADAVRYMLDYSTKAAPGPSASGVAIPVTPDPAVAAVAATPEVVVGPSNSDNGAPKPSARVRQRVEPVSLRPREDPMSGAEVYEHGCYLCHGPGLTGAPRLDDKREWRRRLRKGREQLYKNAINGFQGKLAQMPPKGGYGYLSDAEIEAAVNFMLRNGR